MGRAQNKLSSRQAKASLKAMALLGAFVVGYLWSDGYNAPLSDEIDVRVRGFFASQGESRGYTARFTDCQNISSVVLGGAQEQVPQEQLQPNAEGICEVEFEASGGGNHSPSLTVYRTDGTSEVYSETFVAEQNAPALTLPSSSPLRVLEDEDGAQHLELTLTVEDDTDISHLNVSMLGLRASQLRAKGGYLEFVYMDSDIQITRGSRGGLAIHFRPEYLEHKLAAYSA